ncbi:hypothetical protein ACM66B_005834 [Microbotryomycetes sp. NB124-2]
MSQFRKGAEASVPPVELDEHSRQLPPSHDSSAARNQPNPHTHSALLQRQRRVEYLLATLATDTDDDATRARTLSCTLAARRQSACVLDREPRTKSLIEIRPKLFARRSCHNSMTLLMSAQVNTNVSPEMPKRSIRRKPAPSRQGSDQAQDFGIEIDRHFSGWSTLQRHSTCSTASSSPLTPRSSLFDYCGSPSTLEEDMEDGLWTSSCDSDGSDLPKQYSPATAHRISLPPTPKSPSSFVSSFSPFKRGHGRTASLTSSPDVSVANANVPSVARRRSGESFDLPLLKLPPMPLLFPEEWRDAPADKASGTAGELCAVDSNSSRDCIETESPTSLDDHTLLMVPPSRRPHVFRIMRGGKAYFIEDSASSANSSPRTDDYHSFDLSSSTGEEDDDDILDII